MLLLVDLFKLFPSLASVTYVWGKRTGKKEAGSDVCWHTGTCSFSHAYSEERRQYRCHMEVKDTVLGKKEQKINARGRQSQLEIGEQLRGILENKFFKNWKQAIEDHFTETEHSSTPVSLFRCVLLGCAICTKNINF